MSETGEKKSERFFVLKMWRRYYEPKVRGTLLKAGLDFQRVEKILNACRKALMERCEEKEKMNTARVK